MILVNPIAITQHFWGAADSSLGSEPSFQRVADIMKADLKTPLGQFQLLCKYVGISRASALMEVAVVATMPEDQWEVLESQLVPEIEFVILHRWKEKSLAPLTAIYLKSTLRSWFIINERLKSKCELQELIQGVKSSLGPSRLWKELECNNVY